jgi:hypothetical protein
VPLAALVGWTNCGRKARKNNATFGDDRLGCNPVAAQGKAARTGLLISTKAKRWGPNYLQFGLASSEDFEGDTTQRFQGQHPPGLKTFPGGAAALP